MGRLRFYYMLPLLVLLLPLSTWMQLTPRTSKAAVAPPALPSPQVFEADALLQAMLAHNLWDKKRGKLALANASGLVLKDASAIKCRLKAISYAQMQAPQAMLECDSKLILLHEGDSLPDKSLLSEIHADHVVLIKVDSVRELYLFGKTVDKKTNDK